MLRRFAFMSPCGGGNLGDAAIVDSLIHGIRRRIEAPEILGITENPDDTLRRHGIATLSLRAPTASERRRIAERRRQGTAASNSSNPAAAAAAAAAPTQRPHPLRSVLGQAPWLRETWRLTKTFADDTRHYRQNGDQFQYVDMVLVAGGGQFDELFGGPLQHPYSLWSYSAIACKRSVPFVVLSVGTGTLSDVSRFLVKRALKNAHYASFRDERSRELIGDAAREVPIVPDLAYGLPLAPAPARTRAALPVVAVSAMAYADPRFWPKKDVQRYEEHVASLVRLSVQLLQRGHEVILFATDRPDQLTLQEVRTRAMAQLAPAELQRLSAPQTEHTVAELMSTLARADVVVAARLHGVLLAHVAGKPALAISHERKVATLMQEMGHSHYCQDIHDYDGALGWQRLQELCAEHERVAQQLREAVERCKVRVDAQYDLIFGPVRSA